MELKNLVEALTILRNAHKATFTGSNEVWQKLFRASQHLEKQVAAGLAE